MSSARSPRSSGGLARGFVRPITSQPPARSRWSPSSAPTSRVRRAISGPLGVGFVLAAVAAVLGLASDRGPTARVLGWRPLRLLGGVSLAVYLWHLPIFYAIARWGRHWGWPVRLLIAMVALVVAVAATKRFVERPIARRLSARDIGAKPVVRSDRVRFARACIAGGLAASVPFLMVLWNFGLRPLRTAVPTRVFSNFYELQARALMHGHLDVPRGSLSIEAFRVSGRDYMYFPPLPAILRMPILAITDSLDGRMTRALDAGRVAAGRDVHGPAAVAGARPRSPRCCTCSRRGVRVRRVGGGHRGRLGARLHRRPAVGLPRGLHVVDGDGDRSVLCGDRHPRAADGRPGGVGRSRDPGMRPEPDHGGLGLLLDPDCRVGRPDGPTALPREPRVGALRARGGPDPAGHRRGDQLGEVPPPVPVPPGESGLDGRQRAPTSGVGGKRWRAHRPAVLRQLVRELLPARRASAWCRCSRSSPCRPSRPGASAVRSSIRRIGREACRRSCRCCSASGSGA